MKPTSVVPRTQWGNQGFVKVMLPPALIVPEVAWERVTTGSHLMLSAAPELFEETPEVMVIEALGWTEAIKLPSPITAAPVVSWHCIPAM